MVTNNLALFQDILNEVTALYLNALGQYVDNRASGRFEKAKIAICNARAFARGIRSARRNLERERARVGLVVAGPCCPECIQGAA